MLVNVIHNICLTDFHLFNSFITTKVITLTCTVFCLTGILICLTEYILFNKLLHLFDNYVYVNVILFNKLGYLFNKLYFCLTEITLQPFCLTDVIFCLTIISLTLTYRLFDRELLNKRIFV